MNMLVNIVSIYALKDFWSCTCGSPLPQIDMDTIEVSNLNRQFLFRKSHVGQSKARFSVVLNGLDNLDARRHVNRMCLAAGVPLVESGTTGYLGQVTVHIKGQTECYECQPKPVPKSYPVCTITSTPSKTMQ